MSRIDLNLNDIKDYVEEGWYLMVIREAEVKEGPKGPYINWKLEVNDPAVESAPPVYHVTSFAAPSMIRNFLEAANFEWNEDGSFHTEDVLGYELEAHLIVDEYQGRKRNSIDKVRPL